MDDLLVRPATREDIPSICHLMKLALGDGRAPRSSKFFCWKHVDNPFGESAILVAYQGDQLVGMRAFMRWRFCCAGQAVPAVRAVDTVTHPDHRGRGIFKRLTLALVDQVRREGVSLIFNTPNGLSRPGYLKMGWRDVGRVRLWTTPLRPKRRAYTHQAASAVFGRIDLFRLTAERRSERLSGKLVTDVSPAYLQWRYDTPGVPYHAHAREDAVVVYSLRTRRGLRELTLLELLAAPGSMGSLRKAVGELLSLCSANYAVAAANSSVAVRALLPNGFIPLPRVVGPRLTARSTGRLAVDPHRHASWNYVLGDLELF